MKLECSVCKRVLTKRKAVKLGKQVYCASDYFTAMKQLEIKDPARFREELDK